MAITLTITDNADGTGGVATIAGSDGASTNTVYRATFDGTLGQYAWSSVGSRSGDGNVTLAVATGYYLWRVDSVVSGEIEEVAVAYQNLTDATTESVLTRIEAAVKTRIQSLSLSGITADRVRVLELARLYEGVDTTPLIGIVSTDSEAYPSVLTGRDDVDYSVPIVFIDKSNQDFTTGRAKRRLWRQQVSRAFRFQRLPGVSEVFVCTPVGGTVVDRAAFTQGNIALSELTLRFTAREPRGLV